MINTAHDCIQNDTPSPPPKKHSLNQCLIWESIKGCTTGILTKEAKGVNNVMTIFHIQWDPKTNVST
jgi:hypothetical protein